MAEKKRKRSRIMLIALAAFTVYVLVSLYFINVDIRERRQDTAYLQEQITEQQIQNEELQEIVDKGEVDENYIIRQAREKLNFAFPDERVFQDIVGN